MKEQEMKIPHSSTWAKIGNKNGEPPNILDHHKTMSCTSERACVWSPASFSVEANSSWLPSLVWGVRVPPRCRDARLNLTHSEPVPQHVADGRGRRPGRGIVLGDGSVCSAAPRWSSKGAAWLTNEVIETQLPSLRLGFSQGSSASFPASIPSSAAPALSSTHPLRSLHSNHPLLSLSRP